MKAVTFRSGNNSIAGNIYFPASFIPSEKYPAIVCVHPGGGVKEQTAGLYAREMAKSGFITLAFDASYQGASSGEPRFLEDPASRVEDIRCAVDFLTTLEYIDTDRLNVLGICAGGGYAVKAACSDRRIRAVGTVSAVDIGTTFRRGWDGTTPVEAQIAVLDNAAGQRTTEANGAPAAFLPYVPETIEEDTIRDMREAHDYYRTPRGCHPNAGNKMLASSIDRIFGFAAFDQVGDFLTQPLMVVAGSDAGSLWQSRELYEQAASRKEFVLIKEATHIALYDRPDCVLSATEKLSAFFKTAV